MAHIGFGKPMDVFTALTGLLGPGPMSPDSYEMLRGKKVCDVVKGELADLKRLDMSAADRMKVEAWETLCNDAGKIVSAQCNQDLATRLGATPANLAGATNITTMVTPELDAADMYSVMAVLATACNFNPVIFLKYPPNYVFSGLGVVADTHNLSHRADNAGLSGSCLPNALSLIQVIDKYYVSKFAKLVGMLDGVTNADGSTLLDSTAAVLFNEMSDGLAQNLNNLPIIQAGSCGGYFKTGWTVNVETGSPTLTQGNSEAQCASGTNQEQYNGISQETGTDPNVANAPINKYYYNLMNAVGVKADPNGYPAKGGIAEVTRFGYSDRTTDFAGGFGGKADAGIHSPGEYTTLKAGS
jgi:hypothetical protein